MLFFDPFDTFQNKMMPDYNSNQRIPAQIDICFDLVCRPTYANYGRA